MAKDDRIQQWIVEADNHLMWVRVRNVLSSPTSKRVVRSVRAVVNPHALANDPDVGGRQDGATLGEYLVYGGLDKSTEIYVDASGVQGYVVAPWEHYSGLAVDQQLVWVFGTEGFACATHASVMRSLTKRGDEPRWMTYGSAPEELGSLLYAAEYAKAEKSVTGPDRTPVRGLVDLCACDDGTLVASLFQRRVTRGVTRGLERPVFTDVSAVYTGAHTIDVEKRTINVDWTKPGRGGKTVVATRVQKTAMACWPLFAGLRAVLQPAPGAERVR